MTVAPRSLSVIVLLMSAAVGLVAAVQPLLALVAAFGVAFTVLTLADLRVGICLFAFSVIPIDNLLAGAVSADKLVAVILALSWLASLTVRGDLRGELSAQAPALAVALALLVVWYTASLVWADNVYEATQQLIRLYPNALLVPILVSAIDSARTMRWLIASFLLGVLTASLIGLMQGLDDPESAGRLAGTSLDANSLAIWLIMAAALALGISADRALEPGKRLLAAGGIALSGVAILATGSRMALIAVAAMLALAPLIVGRGRRLAAILTAVAVAGVAVFYIAAFATPEVRERIVNPEDDGGSGRTSLWAVGGRMVEANPVLGVGGGNFVVSSVRYVFEPGRLNGTRQIIDRPQGAHNTFLQVTAETGLVGGALFVLIVGLALTYTLRALRRARVAGMRDVEVLARAALFAYAGVLVSMLFIGVDNSKPLWMLIAVGPALLKLTRSGRTPE